MSHPLDGCWAKIERAHEHFDLLEAETQGFAQTQSITLAQTFDPNANKIRVVIDKVPAIPRRWALIAADGVQNLRAALNYLVWELAKWNLERKGAARDPALTTQFPISDQPIEVQNRSSRRS